MPSTIEIDVSSRSDAIALMERLASQHSYLMQFAPRRWLVHAECPGSHGELLPSALAAIEDWLAAREVEGVQVRVDGEAYLRVGRGSKPV